MSVLFRSLSRVGLPDFEISAAGKIRRISTGEIITRTSDLPQPESDVIRIRGLDGSGIRVSFLVAMAWYDQNSAFWSDSQYAENIANAGRFFRIPINDRRSTGIVDNYGNFYTVTKNGELWNTTTFNRTSGVEKDSGYLGIAVRNNGKVENFFMHRLVASAFCPVPSGLLAKGYTKETLEVNHRDGNKHNNKWFNLEWVTSQQNIEHASNYGLLSTSISDDELNIIFRMLQRGKTDIEISKLMCMPAITISTIRARRCPRYDTPNYKWPSTSSEAAKYQRAEFVRSVVDDYNSGMTKSEICYKHRITSNRLTAILLNNRSKITRYYRQNSNYLDEQQVRKICGLIMEGKSNIEIGTIMGIRDRVVSTIRNKQSYPQWVKDYDFSHVAELNEKAIMKKKYLDIILAEENKDLTPTELANKYNLNLRTVKHYKHVLKHPKK